MRAVQETFSYLHEFEAVFDVKWTHSISQWWLTLPLMYIGREVCMY